MIHTSIPTIYSSLYPHDQLYVDNYRFLGVGREEINSHLIEKNRLQMQHYISKYIWKNRNFYSPIENKLNKGEFRVLEIGHGASGAWLIDMATEFPNSTFVGVDLTNPILENENKPDNVGFLRCDVINDGIPFPDNTFDFIYQNLNIFSFLTESQYPELIEDMIRVIKPGAWIELLEGSYEFENVGPITGRLISSTIAYLKKIGIKSEAISNIKYYLQTSESFSTNIYTEEVNVPLFGGTLGAFTFNFFKTYHKNIRIDEFMGLSEDEFEEILNFVSQEVEIYETKVKCFRLYAKKKDY